jgi:shikimate dehydrogenase
MIKLGLIGWPVSHSLSPKLHIAALQAVGLEGEYRLYPIEPSRPEKLIELLGRVRSGELSGLNVTIPHKQVVIPFMDDLTPVAREIGAVNTIFMDKKRLVGHNTDASGFLADVRKKSGKRLNSPGNALVLGAGGSARAVVSALIGISWQVTIAARNVDQSSSLKDHFIARNNLIKIDSRKLDAVSLEPLLGNTNLVVNTTPVGMHPNNEFSPWPEGLAWPEDAFIYDLIYNPRQTLFTRQAKLAGLDASNGLGMLVEQAAVAFEVWTRKKAPFDNMLSALSPE